MLTSSKISDYLVKIIKIGILAAIFLPLVMNSNFFFPFIVLKNVSFHIVVEVVFIAYLILAQLDVRYRPRFDKVSWSVLAFFGISIVAWLLGIGLYRGFWGNYERMGGIFHLLHLVLFFFTLVNVVKDKKDWYDFFTFSVFSSLLMCFLGLAQYFEIPFLLRSSGGRRLTGTVGNATFFAAYLLFNLFFILFFLWREKRFQLKLFASSFLVFDVYLVCAAILSKLFAQADWGILNILKAPLLTESFVYPQLVVPFVALQLLILAVWIWRLRPYLVSVLLVVLFIFEFFIFFNTQTRGAIIGFFVGLVLLALVSLFLKVDHRLKIASGGFLVLMILTPVLLVLAKNTPVVQNNGTLNRLATISFSDITTESRLLTWQTSWQGWIETPKSFLIGYGPENYYYAFNKRFPSSIYKDRGSQIWFDRAHNIIFDVGVTTGIIGLVAYLAILVFAALTLIKNYRARGDLSSSWLLVALLVGYFIQNIFVFDTLNTEVPFFLLLAFIAYLGLKPQEDNQEHKPANFNIIYTAVLVIVLAFGVLGINVRTLQANHYIFKALTVTSIDLADEDSGFGLLKKSLAQGLPGRFEVREQMANYVLSLANNENFPESDKKPMIDFMVDELTKSINEEPLNIRNYIFLSTFYNATTRFNKLNPQRIIDMFTDKVIALSPSRAHIYYEIGQEYAYGGNFEKAEQYFNKGIALSPEVFEDRWSLLTIYIIFGKNEQADAYFESMKKDFNWKPTADDYERLVNLYARVKNYDRMIELQQQIIELEPTAENYARLAAQYAKTGKNQQAIDATNQAVAINPDFKTEADEFLELLESGQLLDINE